MPDYKVEYNETKTTAILVEQDAEEWDEYLEGLDEIIDLEREAAKGNEYA